jgi:3-phosphoshikimate 1-carboxyvinyltransferase
MQRACAAALVNRGTTILLNPGISADDKAALEIIQQLGATVSKNREEIIIESSGVQPVANEISCGESGLSVRMFTSIAATASRLMNITGKGSLLTRPLAFFDDTLPPLGVQVHSKNGYLPLSVQGPMNCKSITVDGSLSSQYITGLLFAYSASGATDVTITVTNLNSRPYVDLTLNIMRHFGLKTPVNRGYKEFYFDTRPVATPSKQPVNYTVESDWSSASFLLVAGAISGSVQLKGLDMLSVQADKAVLEPLAQAGAVVAVHEAQVNISKKNLDAFRFDATHCPDLFPPLVALAAYCTGTSVIEGVHRLAHKESNRALTLQQEFAKMGIEITLEDDRMMITGGPAKGAPVHSQHDHRIAMACAVAALGADGITTVDEAEAVNKSYPQFWEHLQQVAGTVSINNAL